MSSLKKGAYVTLRFGNRRLVKGYEFKIGQRVFVKNKDAKYFTTDGSFSVQWIDEWADAQRKAMKEEEAMAEGESKEDTGDVAGDKPPTYFEEGSVKASAAGGGP